MNVQDFSPVSCKALLNAIGRNMFQPIAYLHCSRYMLCTTHNFICSEGLSSFKSLCGVQFYVINSVDNIFGSITNALINVYCIPSGESRIQGM